MDLFFRLTAAMVALLCGAAVCVWLAVRSLLHGRTGRAEAMKRVPWLFLIAFILLILSALAWAAYVVMRAEGRL